MLLDRPKEELARDLKEQAVKFYGPKRAEELEKEIERVSSWLALIAPHRLEIDSDEPDFLVAPHAEGEAR